MRGVIIHAPKDIRIEDIETVPLGPRDVRVRIEAGGICGSDLHYYNHGGFGTVRLREPMALGHEIAGTIDEIGHDSRASRPEYGSPSIPADRATNVAIARRASKPVPRHALHRQRDALSTCSRRLSPKSHRRREPGRSDRAGDVDAGGRDGRASGRLSPCRPSGRFTSRSESACYRLRTHRCACGPDGAIQRRV